MGVHLTLEDYAKYPFLEEAQEYVQSQGYTLDHLLSTGRGKWIAEKAADRIISALSTTLRFDDDITLDIPEIEVLCYSLARLLTTCLNNRAVTERLMRFEADRALHFLQQEEVQDWGDPEKRTIIARKVGINPQSDEMDVRHYVELASGLRDDRWRLVNRIVRDGKVGIQDTEIDELLREQIRIILQKKLPRHIPTGICDSLQPLLEKIEQTHHERILEDFGDVEEELFPPCIQALIKAVSEGTNIPHTGRFALTAFLHTIGMNPLQIVEVFTRAPDFDVSKTMYQVEHISGAGGTEYTPPACATMRTYGLCVNRVKLCERINHPLSFYKIRKKEKS